MQSARIFGRMTATLLVATFVPFQNAWSEPGGPTVDVKVIGGIVSINMNGRMTFVGDGQQSNGARVGPGGQLSLYSHDPNQTLAQFGAAFMDGDSESDGDSTQQGSNYTSRSGTNTGSTGSSGGGANVSD